MFDNFYKHYSLQMYNREQNYYAYKGHLHFHNPKFSENSDKHIVIEDINSAYFTQGKEEIEKREILENVEYLNKYTSGELAHITIHTKLKENKSDDIYFNILNDRDLVLTFELYKNDILSEKGKNKILNEIKLNPTRVFIYNNQEDLEKLIKLIKKITIKYHKNKYYSYIIDNYQKMIKSDQEIPCIVSFFDKKSKKLLFTKEINFKLSKRKIYNLTNDENLIFEKELDMEIANFNNSKSKYYKIKLFLIYKIMPHIIRFIEFIIVLAISAYIEEIFKCGIEKNKTILDSFLEVSHGLLRSLGL